MFTLKGKNPSALNLLNNPQISSKASSRKNLLNDRDSLRERELQSRLSTVLPKIKKPLKNNQTISDFFEAKKKQKSHTKQLSLAISKYHLHRGQFAKKPMNELSLDIMNVLNCFSMVENNFQELFMQMKEDLKGLLYLTTNAGLVEKYQIKEGELYKKIVEDIDANVDKKLKDAYQKTRDAINAKEQIEVEYQRYKLFWKDKQKKYVDEIQWLKKLTNPEYIKYLEEKIQQQTQRIEELQVSEKSLVKLRDELQKEIKNHETKIQEQLKQISRLNMVIYDLKIGKNQSEKIILKLRDRFDQFNLKMKGIKQIIADVQKQNQDLKTQRAYLIKRAAVSFEQLTPRPKYKKVMNFTEKQQTFTLKSTAQITEVLLKKIENEAFKEEFRCQLFDEKLVGKRELHPKLEQAEKIRQNTQVSISQSKSELRHLEKVLSKEEQS